MSDNRPPEQWTRDQYRALPVEAAAKLRRAWRQIAGPLAAAPNGAPFPLRSWPPDAAIDIQALAEWADPLKPGTIQRFASAAARDTAIPAGSRQPGMHSFLLDKQSLQFVDTAGEWRRYDVTLYPSLSAPAAVPGNSALSVTFPAGAFGVNPVTVASPNTPSGTPGFAFVGSATPSGGSVYWHQLSGAAAARSVYLIAMGREQAVTARAEQPGPVMTVTCPTDGCENRGIPLEVPLLPAAQCGPCGTDLTSTIRR
jgi:hypothetical protein